VPGGARDPRLAGFVKDGPGDTCPPSAALAAVVEDLSGPERHCEDATDDELIGLLGRWDALESWAAAGKLGVVRELIRRRARPGPGGYQRMKSFQARTHTSARSLSSKVPNLRPANPGSVGNATLAKTPLDRKSFLRWCGS
jgi:hypothetical protein